MISSEYSFFNFFAFYEGMWLKIEKQKFRKKKIAIIVFILLLVIAIGVTIALYISKKPVRDWIDIYILKKNLTEEDIQVINLNIDKNNQIYVYGDNIAVLKDKALTLYNPYGEKITTLDVNINSAIYDSSDKYFVLAENGGKEVCLILDKTYLWSTSTEGDILQVHVNRNGYVVVITTDIAHKSITTMYNSEGKKLFTTYFASTRIIDASISQDNKYIAIAELDSSGAILQSNIKIISVENAKKDPKNTIIYTYNATKGDLISNIEYQENEKIICLYDKKINAIENKINNEILHLDKDNITFASNNLKSHIVYVEEQSEGLFNVSSNIHIINTTNNEDTIYKIEDNVKDIYTCDNTIAINTGTEIHVINTRGWLIKKYSARQEISNVKLSTDVIAIIYKDKVEIIDL